MKKIVVIFLVLSIIISFVGCAGGLNGNWYPEDGKASYGFPRNMCLYKDGTGNIEGVDIEWETKSNVLKIDAGWLGNYTFDYKLSGNKVILIDGEDKEIYIKKD